MINTSGVLAVLDHGITLNWDDGPTLHKIGAQVRYHTAESATSKTVRVTASSRYSDQPDSFMVVQDGLRASWVWQERAPGWTAQLAITNNGEDDIFLDGLDAIRIDTAFGGLFNIGAPPGLWQVSGDEAAALLPAPTRTESQMTADDRDPAPSQTDISSTLGNKGFRKSRELIVQPAASNRTRPPALMIRVLDVSLGASAGAMPTELALEANGERFERFVARYKTDGLLVASGVGIATPEFWIIAGDDVAELKNLS